MDKADAEKSGKKEEKSGNPTPRSGRKKINVPFLFLLYTLVCNLLGGKKTCTIGLLCIHAWLKNQAGTGKRETETETEKEEAQIIYVSCHPCRSVLAKKCKAVLLGFDM